jgi:hypothetical protein
MSGGIKPNPRDPLAVIPELPKAYPGLFDV